MEKMDNSERITAAISEFIGNLGSLNQKNLHKVMSYIEVLLAVQEKESLSTAESGGKNNPRKNEAGGITHVLRCSFCGKSNSQVQCMIEGPNVWICNECVHLCQLALQEPYDLRDVSSDETA